MHGEASLQSVAQRRTVWLILSAGALLRVVLVLRAPRPYGYVYDYYHAGVQVLYRTGRLPIAADCPQCYHPPVFYTLGLPFYALGRWLHHGPGSVDAALRWLSMLSVLCGVVCVWYGWRLLVLFGRRGWDLVLGLGLIVVFPCLVISSYGIEADIVLTSFMIAFIYYLCLFWRDPQRAGAKGALRLGVLAGLAAATKYNGLVALAAFGVLVVLHVGLTRPRRSLVALSGLVMVTAVLVGGWKYVDNVRERGTPLYANGSAQQGFKLGSHRFYLDRYEFDSLRVRQLLHLWSPTAPKGLLTDLAVYRSVPTTLYAMAWTDMTFFSEPTRGYDYLHPYLPRPVSQWLVAAVLALGVVPTGLVVVGGAMTLKDRAYWPLAVMTGLTIAAYVLWFLSQELWALKTKYVLFLLPAYVLYAVVGLERVRRLRWRLPGQVLTGLLVLLIGFSYAYLMVFAIGRHA